MTGPERPAADRAPGSSRPGRLGIGVVGAGRVGAVLAAALRDVGHAVVGASGVSERSRERIDVMLPGVPRLEVPEVVRRSELVLLTVPDDALADLVAGLAATGSWQPGQLVLHTSGRHGLVVLAPAVAAGAIGLAVHPAMTFTGTSLDLGRLTGAAMAVTAPAAVLPVAQALVIEMGGEPVVLAESARPAYHAALSHAANHLTTLLGQAGQVLDRAGVEEPSALLGPLVRAAVDNVLRAGEAALTGPVARGDAETVADHLAVLSELDRSEVMARAVAPSYVALARLTALRAVADGRLDDAEGRSVLEVLQPSPLGTPQTQPPQKHRPVVVRTRADARAARARLPGRVAVVMTMGALHAGHASLVREAARHADHVVVTVFVNPLQFGSPVDLDTYPRTWDTDLAALSELGVDLVVAPALDEVYPRGEPQVTVAAGPLGELLEGASRPGHFDGVLTVVSLLLNLLRPDVAVFGQKDRQQLALVRRLVEDLALGVLVVGGQTVREADGLAMSSRNVRLSPAGRRAALALSRACEAAVAEADAGGTPEEVLSRARRLLDQADGVLVDYCVLVDPDTLAPVTSAGTAAAGTPADMTPAVLLVAAEVDGTRLIDSGDCWAATT